MDKRRQKLEIGAAPGAISFLSLALSVAVGACAEPAEPDAGRPDPAGPAAGDPEAVRLATAQLHALRGELGLTGEDTFRARSVLTDGLGQTHVRFEQLHGGVRVWGAEAISHAPAAGAPLAPTAAVRGGIRIPTTPTLTAAEAAARARASLGAVPGFVRDPAAGAELVIYPRRVTRAAADKAHLAPAALNALDMVTEVESYHLAYHVHTEIEAPGDTRHTDFLIDAQTGGVLERWDSLETAAAVGTGNSQYSGVKSINTSSVTGGYELRDTTRATGAGTPIYNLDHQTSGTGAAYVDADNAWGDGANYKEAPEPTTSANGQTAAVDAAFGVQSAWDLYKNVFGRNGITNQGAPLYVRVHYDSSYDNAFYSDTCGCITFGDGNLLQTLTALDVTAHEFTHGVTSATAGLIYSQESGGLNEASSDIFGALTEFYVRGANGQGSVIPDTGGNWTQGEQLVTPAAPTKMRWLYKPSKDGHSADAWSATLKNLDVHYSSGPMNRAFYFLSQGATTTGDTSSQYLPAGMTGIGNQKAGQIWYRALTVYLTPSSDYAAARVACIQAARDLFPLSGPEEIAVWNAFAAINVGGPWAGPDAAPTVTVSTAGASGTLTFSATASDDKGVAKVDFLWDNAIVGTDTTAPYSATLDSTLEDDGAHALVARATDTAGLPGTAGMTVNVANGQLLKNGSFEKGYGVGWSNTSGMQIGAILNTPSYDGTKCAKFNGLGSTNSVSLYQTVTVPAAATAVSVSYALKVETQEASGTARDTFTAQILSTSGAVLRTLATYSNLNAGASYTVYTFDLAAFAGQTIQLKFTGTEDSSVSTGFIIDRVRLIANATGGGDTAPPTITVSEAGTSGSITLSATASDNVGVARVDFLVDGTVVASDTTSPYSVALNSTTLTNGAHSLVGKAYDAAGNVGTSSAVSFSINNGTADTTAPTVSASEAGTSGSITLSATASDNVGVTRVELLIDGTLRATLTTAPYTTSFDSTTLANGSHTLVAKAYDAAGNVGTSSTVTFSITNGTQPTTYAEVESNGTLATANAVADSVLTITGYVGTSTDQDFFRINVAAGRTVTVRMTGPARDYDLYLLNASGGTIASSAGSGSTETVSTTNTATTATTYYVKVVGFGGAFDTVNPYSLSVTR